MRIEIVSKDGVFAALQGILAEVIPDSVLYIFHTVSLEDLNDSANLYILDFQLDVSLPKNIRWSYSNLVVLAHR